MLRQPDDRQRAHGAREPQQGQRAQDVQELRRRIAKEKDRVPPSVFAELAGVGGEDSLAVLEEAVGLVRTIECLAPAYEAFALYAGGPLADRARQFLARDAFRAKHKEARPVIVRTLRVFGDASLSILERVLSEHSDPACQKLACDPLVALLAGRGDVVSIQSILDFASVGWDAAPAAIGVAAHEQVKYAGKRERDVVRAALDPCTAPEAQSLLVARLATAETSRDWKLLLVDLLAARPREELTRALAGAFADPDHYDLPAGVSTFDDQLEFSHETPQKKDFSAGGDSGTIILDAESLRPYALLYGGGPDGQGIDRTLGHFLKPVLDKLKVRPVS